ncbi:hypothetical protein XELAEV_18001093mg [Xenopus laevis]|nr:hypothetical protein XELAEV_18001093mg [Xenopus laevis]
MSCLFYHNELSLPQNDSDTVGASCHRNSSLRLGLGQIPQREAGKSLHFIHSWGPRALGDWRHIGLAPYWLSHRDGRRHGEKIPMESHSQGK